MIHWPNFDSKTFFSDLQNCKKKVWFDGLYCFLRFGATLSGLSFYSVSFKAICLQYTRIKQHIFIGPFCISMSAKLIELSCANVLQSQMQFENENCFIAAAAGQFIFKMGTLSPFRTVLKYCFRDVGTVHFLCSKIQA